MNPLTLSVIGNPNQLQILTEVLQRAKCACRLQEMAWEGAWEKLARTALYRAGPEVSQVGITWLDSLLSTGSVRPFTDEEVEAMGGPSSFIPALWRTVSPPGWRLRVWAVPWLSDVRVVFYWRDILEQAGIDAGTAFQTPERVEETMERLRASRVEVPWGIWAVRVNVTMHNAASWIWSKGGDIVSANGKEILFDQPQAMEGLLAYFRLHRYLPPGLDRLPPDNQVIDLFAARRVAVVMGPCYWFGYMTKMLAQSPGLAERIGIALPPGPAFVGGSHLIIWQHTARADEAAALVRFLVSKEAQAEYCYAADLLPGRPDVLAEPPYTEDNRYQVIIEALQNGRTFPVVPHWGDVEDRLRFGFVSLWDDLLAEPNQDLEALVRPRIEAIAMRLAVTMGIRR